MDNNITIDNKIIAGLLEKGIDLNGAIRDTVEKTINTLLENELSSFLGYERYSVNSEATANRRNGYYSRELATTYGKINVSIPRDRLGEFNQHTVPKYKRCSDDLANIIIMLYRNGVTTREISQFIERIYGKYYCPTTVCNIAKVTEEELAKFHHRKMHYRYVAIFMDATYVNLRRDSVAKDAIHVIMGLKEDGTKEVLDYAIYPSETASNYLYMLEDLKKRGLKQALIFISDGIPGIREVIARVYPKALHQSCWVHIDRRIYSSVRSKERKQLMLDLKRVYTRPTAEDAERELNVFIDKYKKLYPRIEKVFTNRDSLFSFYKMPVEIRNSVYTTNIIENNNHGLKRQVKIKEQFPNEDSVDRFCCSYYANLNARASKCHKTQGTLYSRMRAVKAEINELFIKIYGEEEACSEN